MKKDTFTESGPLCPRCGIRYNECDCYVAEMHPENYPNPPQSQPEVQQGERVFGVKVYQPPKPSLKSQLESVVGELEKRLAENHRLKREHPEKSHSYLHGKIDAYDHAANRLRELLKGQNDSH